MRVIVTGAAGRLARVLLPALCAQADAVVGIDVRPVSFSHRRFRQVMADLTCLDARPLLRGADALVHLAARLLRGRGPEAAMRAVNVGAGQRLFAQAAEAGVARLVHLSSAAVYGSGRALSEEAPLHPLPGFAYARHKAELDAWLAATLPGVVRLRPHVILGPHCQPLLRRLLALPVYLADAGLPAEIQAVHEADVVEAILLALARPTAQGAYNLAARAGTTYRALIRARHRWALPLSYPIARGALAMAWRLTGFGGEPGWLAGLAAGLTVDSSRARRGLGWRPRYDDTEALARLL